MLEAAISQIGFIHIMLVFKKEIKYIRRDKTHISVNKIVIYLIYFL